MPAARVRENPISRRDLHDSLDAVIDASRDKDDALYRLALANLTDSIALIRIGEFEDVFEE